MNATNVTYKTARQAEEFFPEQKPEHIFTTRLMWTAFERRFGLMSEKHRITGPDEGKSEFIKSINKFIPEVASITSNEDTFHTDANNWQLLIDKNGIRIIALAHGHGYMYLQAFKY